MKHHLSRRERKKMNRENIPRAFMSEVPYVTLAQAEYVDTHLEKELNDWRAGVWQYLCDHATPHKRGYIVRFIATNEKTFWQRVESRKLGKYSRNNLHAMNKKIDELIYGSVFQARSAQFLRDARHPFWFRVVLTCRNVLNKKVDQYVKKHVKKKWEEFPIYKDED